MKNLIRKIWRSLTEREARRYGLAGEPLQSPERPYCQPGCFRVDGHDGRDEGACMFPEDQAGTGSWR